MREGEVRRNEGGKKKLGRGRKGEMRGVRRN